jgi:hypothetical protein
MEAPSEIGDGIAETHAGHQPMQSDDVAAAGATGMAAEMSIDRGNTHRRIPLVSDCMERAANQRPLAARLADQQTMICEVASRCRQRVTIKSPALWSGREQSAVVNQSNRVHDRLSSGSYARHSRARAI